MRFKALLVMAAMLPITATQADEKVLKVELVSFQEVPALSSSGSGEFRARISNDGSQIQYELTYDGMTDSPTQAHIHFGQKSVNGGISVFLCSNLGNGPVGTQACPAQPGVITGTITAADVIGPTGQGIAAGELAELVSAIRAGAAYVNVHTVAFPGGEIRSQLGGHGHGHGH